MCEFFQKRWENKEEDRSEQKSGGGKAPRMEMAKKHRHSSASSAPREYNEPKVIYFKYK